MTSETPTIGMIALSGSDILLGEPGQDIRGRKLRDHTASEIGTINDLLVDDGERKVRYMLVGVGGFLGIGEKTVVIPIDAITAMGDDWVQVREGGEAIADGPSYDPRRLGDEEYHREISSSYGYPAYSAPGYVYPTYWRPRVQR